MLKKEMIIIVLLIKSLTLLRAQCDEFDFIHTLHECNGLFHSEKIIITDKQGNEVSNHEFVLIGSYAEFKTNKKSNKLKISNGFIMDSLSNVFTNNSIELVSNDNKESCLIGQPFNTLKVEDGMIKVSSFSPVEPSCRPQSGCIVLNGLSPFSNYDFYMNDTNQPIFKNIKTNENGQVVILGQEPGKYRNIHLKSGNCISNTGELLLKKPEAIPKPWIKNGRNIGEGSVKLMATGKGKIQWYDGDTLIHIGNVMQTPELRRNKTYKVIANYDDCISEPELITAIIDNPLNIFEIAEKNENQGKQILLNGSQIGIVYRLYKDNEIIMEIMGNGQLIDFGIFKEKGNYRVKAMIYNSQEQEQKGMVKI
jgi:hypothetical protein